MVLKFVRMISFTFEGMGEYVLFSIFKNIFSMFSLLIRGILLFIFSMYTESETVINSFVIFSKPSLN